MAQDLVDDNAASLGHKDRQGRGRKGAGAGTTTSKNFLSGYQYGM